MARVPVEVIDVSQSIGKIVHQTMQLANSLQEEFWFTAFSPEEEHQFYPYAFRNIKSTDFLDVMRKVRQEMRGYHPYMIAIVDAYVEGTTYSNLFGSHRAKAGIAFFTTHGVFEHIVPTTRIHCYILYYLARYSLSFVAPDRKNHDDTRECAFDRKISKNDLLLSMKGRPFCDECRRSLINEANAITSKQIMALDTLFGTTKTLLEQGYTFIETPSKAAALVVQPAQKEFPRDGDCDKR